MNKRVRNIRRRVDADGHERPVVAWGTQKNGRTIGLVWLPAEFHSEEGVVGMFVVWPATWEIALLDAVT